MLKLYLFIIVALTLGLCQSNNSEILTNSSNMANSIEIEANNNGSVYKTQETQSDRSAKNDKGDKSDKSEVVYTEDIMVFKTDQVNRRVETVIGCMVISSNYIRQNLNDNQDASTGSSFDFLKGSNDNEVIEILKDNKIYVSDTDKLLLMKKCMKRIKRKEAIAAITSIAGRNIERVLTLPQLLDQSQRKELSRLKLIQQKTPTFYQLYLEPKSQFDLMLLEYLNKFTSELTQYKSKSKLEKTLNEELKKRTYHYFGIIPANEFTHTMILITFSTSIVFCCTCYKYSKKRQQMVIQRNKEKVLRNHTSFIEQRKVFSKKGRRITDIQ